MKIHEILLCSTLGGATAVTTKNILDSHRHEENETVDIEVSIQDCKEVHDALSEVAHPQYFYKNRVYTECWRVFANSDKN